MDRIILGNGLGLPLHLGNRHGLITGATGTGKTVSLQRLAEGFSAAGVPVFMSDIKGDLSGIATGFPVNFWDLHEEEGLSIKTSVMEMGPLVLSRLLGLNKVQEGVLNIAFRWLEDPEFPVAYGCRLMDLDDLRASVGSLMEWREELRELHGNVTSATVGAIQRALLTLEAQGGNLLFGEPALDIRDFMQVDEQGRGIVNLLTADRLVETPRLYGAFLLWLLLELFRVLPEAGDLDKPKLVFFFDEAHLLFAEADKTLLETIERVVRLIRSKGVGVYFVTQKPSDVPDSVLAQLGHRVQHALRAFTPRDQKAVKVAAGTFRQNPAIKTADVITQLGVGEALVSFLGADGVPDMVERIKVDLPSAQVGPLPTVWRYERLKANPLRPRYGRKTMSREEARIIFDARTEPKEQEAKATWRDDTSTEKSQAENSETASANSTDPLAGSPERPAAARTSFWRRFFRQPPPSPCSSTC